MIVAVFICEIECKLLPLTEFVLDTLFETDLLPKFVSVVEGDIDADTVLKLEWDISADLEFDTDTDSDRTGVFESVTVKDWIDDIVIYVDGDTVVVIEIDIEAEYDSPLEPVLDILELLDNVSTDDIVLVKRTDLDTLADGVPVFDLLFEFVIIVLDVWDFDPISLLLTVGE